MTAPTISDPPLSAGLVPRLANQDLFPGLDYDPFLAHAAISPLHEPGKRAIEGYAQSIGRWGNGAFPMWMAQRERLRSTLARMLNVHSNAVALSSGCSHSITDVALALPWKAGQHLLTFQGEFPANVVPYQQAARAMGGRLSWLNLPVPGSPSAASEILDVVERALRSRSERVAYLAVSAVQFQTGLRMPLEGLGRLCEQYDVRFLVDGIQACGVVPLDLTELRVDAFFSGAHKWLLGIEGAGFGVVVPRLGEQLIPKTAGWLSREHGSDFLFQGAGLLRYDQPYLPAPRVFEGSTANAIGLAALEAGVDILMHLGPRAVYEHVQSLHDFLEPRLEERGFHSLRSPDPALRSCILSLAPPGGVDIGHLFRELERRRIRVSIPDGLLRLAPHFHNTKEQMETLLGALDEIVEH